MASLTFGARIETGIPSYQDAADLARLSEEVGYDSVWVRDHVALPEMAPFPDCLECFTTMAGFARDTQRVQIGSLVSCVPWRNPALVAKMAATIDQMSNGRFVLGLGAGATNGAPGREFERYGWDRTISAGARARMVAEAAQIAKLMWTEPAPSFEGEFYRIDEAVCEPKPVRGTIPILIGASGERVGLWNVVKYADIWNSTQLLDGYVEKMDVVKRYLDEAGRDPATLVKAVNQTLIICPESEVQARVDKLVEDWGGAIRMNDRVIAGPPEYIAERIRPFIEAGADKVITYFWEADVIAQKECTEAFGKDVIPLLRQIAAAV